MVFCDGNEIEKQRRMNRLDPLFPPLVCQSSVLVSTASYSPVPLPLSSPHPLTYSPLPLRPKNVRYSSTKQLNRLQSCDSLIPARLLPFSRPHPKGPLTQNVKRSLNITNPNADPVSFKIKTTAPKVRLSRVQILPRLPVSQAVLRTAQLRKG
jgi:hypothetical protein